MDASGHPAALTESARLAALADLAILDTDSEREFDAITKVAASVLGASSAAVSLIDRDRQWFKSKYGLPEDFIETPRDMAFCSHTICQNADRKGELSGEFVTVIAVIGTPCTHYNLGTLTASRRTSKLVAMLGNAV